MDSGPATKTFVAGKLLWEKVDQNGNLLGGATFQVTAMGQVSQSPVRCRPLVAQFNFRHNGDVELLRIGDDFAGVGLGIKAPVLAQGIGVAV